MEVKVSPSHYSWWEMLPWSPWRKTWVPHGQPQPGPGSETVCWAACEAVVAALCPPLASLSSLSLSSSSRIPVQLGRPCTLVSQVSWWSAGMGRTRKGGVNQGPNRYHIWLWTIYKGKSFRPYNHPPYWTDTTLFLFKKNLSLISMYWLYIWMLSSVVFQHTHIVHTDQITVISLQDPLISVFIKYRAGCQELLSSLWAAEHQNVSLSI